MQSYNVLLVEDTPTEARHIKRILASQVDHRFSMTHCERLADAHQRLADQAFDVVLLDLHLPDSVELSGVKELSGRYPQTPIIVLTNHDSEQTGVPTRSTPQTVT